MSLRPVLEIKFQDSQGWYTDKPCLKQPKEEERKIKGKKKSHVAILLWDVHSYNFPKEFSSVLGASSGLLQVSQASYQESGTFTALEMC